MPNGQTSFQEKWLEQDDGNKDVIGNWCSKGKSSTDAHCMFCNTSFSISNAGKSQLLQHAATLKHIRIAKQRKQQKTLSCFGIHSNEADQSSPSCSKTALSKNKQITYHFGEQNVQAEALWAIKVAVSNYSFASCSDIVPLFQKMFKDNTVANNMHLSERKMSYVLAYGLGPYFYEDLVCDLKQAINLKSYFTLAFDETTTTQVKKQMDISVRFWSPRYNTIISSYLTSLFFGHANAADISSGIINFLKSNDLPLSKMLTLSMDGPNVNLAVVKKINEELKNLGECELINFGTCTLHKVHNCFSKALDSLPLDVDELSTDLFSFFRVSAARRQDLREVEKLLECEEKFLLRHVNSRWLTLGPVVDRIVHIYSALQEYFLTFLPKDKARYGLLQSNSRYKRIVSVLKDPITIVYLKFISSITPNLEEYLKVFQSEGPLVHLLYSKMSELLQSIMLRFIKESSIEASNILTLDLEDFTNYRPLMNIDVGEGARRALLSIKELQAKEARMAMRSFLLKLCKQLKHSLPLSDKFIKDLEKLHPAMRAKPCDSAIRRLCIKFKKLNFDDNAVDIILGEWRAYKIDMQVNEFANSFTESKRIDIYWANILDLKDFSGNSKFSNLGILVKNCLALPHANSDVERGFSLNKAILADNRTSLSERTLIALRNVKDAVRRHGGIASVPITAKLVKSVAKSFSVYKSVKDSEKDAVEAEKKKRKLEEDATKHENEAKKQKEDVTNKIKHIDKLIKNLQDDLSAGHSCLQEGNSRLQTSIKQKNTNEMKVASTMIEAASKKIENISDELKKLNDKKFNLLNLKK